MALTIRVSPDDASGHTVRVCPAGSLDSVTAPALERELAPILNGAATVLVLDLTGLAFMSSAGIRVILTARKRLAARGGTVLLASPQPQVAKAFDIIRALPDLALFKSVAELDEHLVALRRNARGA
jgi:anti-sigma B factor antagonist